jgi:hypothetical protein
LLEEGQEVKDDNEDKEVRFNRLKKRLDIMKRPSNCRNKKGLRG